LKRCILIFAICLAAQGHDIITTSLTWTHDISRILYPRCAACHHEGGTAFSLMTYGEVRPWAVAIKEEVLERRMPPWGAVKGFRDLRDDQALTPEEMERIISWTDGGVPEGEPKDLPPLPKFADPAPPAHPPDEIVAGANFKLHSALRLDGLWPVTVPDKASFQITAELPDGTVEPLLWLKNYRVQFGHPFLFRTPLNLPSGTIIRGVPPSASVALLPAAAP
jgi:hypothetical protein